MKNIISIIVLAFFSLASINIQAQEIIDAVKNNDPEKIKILLETDVTQINIKDPAGNTPLHIAAVNGSVPLVEMLLSKGADINAVNTQLNTPLHLAIMNGKDEVCKYLIEKGTDLTKQNIVKKTPLHLTVRHNRRAIAEILIAKGAVVDSRDDMQRTPLGLAARESGNVDIAALLINKGADVNVKDAFNEMPLNYAAWKGFNKIIDLLLDNGADYDTTGGRTIQLLRFAAACGSARLFKIVSAKEKNLFKNESLNNGIMRTAISGGSTEIVNILLSKNVPIKHNANIYGWTPLHFAAYNGHSAMIELLVNNGAELSKRTLSGRSPYNLAEQAGKKDALQLLIKLGCKPEPQQFPELKGAYLGQTPPGKEPEIFAPDIVSMQGEGNHSSLSISPNGKEIYWQSKSQIWTTKLLKDKWTVPEIVSFSKTTNEILGDDVPIISPDGKKIFFTSMRSIGNVSIRKENIWYVDRTSTGWSEPKLVGPEVNAMQLHWQASVANSGTLYFSGNKSDGYGGYDIYYSLLVNGEYIEPINLGSLINSNINEYSPYIAPDESFIIFNRMGREENHLYISFKSKDGQWLKPIKLDESLAGVCPVISPDGKYIFYLGSGIVWASAQFIEELRPKE